MPKYSVQFKEEVLGFFEKEGIIETCKKYNLGTTTIYRWQRKKRTVGFMRKQNKTYTAEEKYEILEYLWKNGIFETEEKFDMNSGIIYKWERMYREYGMKGLALDGRGRPPKHLGPKNDITKNKDILEELQMLRMENLYLKKLDALVQEREEQEKKKKLK